MTKKKIIKNYFYRMFPYDILAMISLIANPIFITKIDKNLRYTMHFFVFFKLYPLYTVIVRIS